MNTITHIPEKKLQEAVRLLFFDPARIFSLHDGRRVQILAPGRINVHDGPDYVDMVLLIGADIHIGNAEFHVRSSDWYKHAHDKDIRYRNLVLHVVLHDDAPELHHQHSTLLLTEQEQAEAIALHQAYSTQSHTSLEDIHTYALLRLLRTTTEHKEILRGRTVSEACVESLRSFISKYEAKRRRPTYTVARLETLLNMLQQSPHLQLLLRLQSKNAISFRQEMSALISTKIADEGAQLRREIIINSFLPLALALALTRDETRISIFEWYWSVEAIGQYGILKRNFPDVPQQYLWQQQGMLEILREKRADTSAHEAIKHYGLVQSLHFYKVALENPELEERP